MPYRKKRGTKKGDGHEQHSKDALGPPEGVALISGRIGGRDAKYAVLGSSANAVVPRPIAKLQGWYFWNSIGAPKYVCAPMVEQSELAFRHLCRRYGTTLCYTPMFHARLFLENVQYRNDQFGEDDGKPEDRPLFVQFCANHPETFLAAARLVQDRCDAVDLNLGCPQGIAKKGNYGSFLMEDFELVFSLVNELHRGLAIPVTAKIRVFDDTDKTLQYAKCLQDAGAQILTVHGRTRENKGPDAVPADWSLIKKIREHVSIPVISNGNIVTFEDVIDCLEETGCAAVMSAEWLRRNPALFNNGENICAFRMALEYFELERQFPAPPGFVKAHVFKLLSTVEGGLNENPEMRQKIALTSDIGEIERLVRELASKRKGEPSFPTGTKADILPANLGSKVVPIVKKCSAEEEADELVDIFASEW
eukprot:759688-Hanusia_phi.AAC.6